MRLRDFQESPIAKDLQDSGFAAEYLEDALDEGFCEFIIALRNVADANGGIGQLATQTDLGRESLYKSLSHTGNSSPYFWTIKRVLDALGLELSIHPKVDGRQAA